MKIDDNRRCKNCEHWMPGGEYGEIPGAGSCGFVPQYWDASEWAEDDETRVLKAKYVGRLAFVQDGSDYRAVLKTMPDFGCVHHQASLTGDKA